MNKIFYSIRFTMGEIVKAFQLPENPQQIGMAYWDLSELVSKNESQRFANPRAADTSQQQLAEEIYTEIGDVIQSVRNNESLARTNRDKLATAILLAQRTTGLKFPGLQVIIRTRPDKPELFNLFSQNQIEINAGIGQKRVLRLQTAADLLTPHMRDATGHLVQTHDVINDLVIPQATERPEPMDDSLIRIFYGAKKVIEALKGYWNIDDLSEEEKNVVTPLLPDMLASHALDVLDIWKRQSEMREEYGPTMRSHIYVTYIRGKIGNYIECTLDTPRSSINPNFNVRLRFANEDSPRWQELLQTVAAIPRFDNFPKP